MNDVLRQDVLIDYLLKQFHGSEHQYFDSLYNLVQDPKYSGLIDLGSIEKSELIRTLHIMKYDYELIDDYNDGTYVIKKEGRKIIREGGWLNYLEQEKQDKINQRENIEASIRTNKSIQENIKNQKKHSIITIFVATVAALGTIGQWLLPLKPKLENQNKEQKEILHRHPKCHHKSQIENMKSNKTDSNYTKADTTTSK